MEGNNAISFEHINVNGINSHDTFIELTNTIDTLESIKAGVYILVETNWDTTNIPFTKPAQHTMKKSDKCAQI